MYVPRAFPLGVL